MPSCPSGKALVPFVSVANMMWPIHNIGLETALIELAGAMKADFARWSSFNLTGRIASHSLEGAIELMPISNGSTYAFEYVKGHSKNAAEGPQTVKAFGLLADVKIGYPVLLSEMTLLTALRTAATSAMVARHLAPRTRKS